MSPDSQFDSEGEDSQVVCILFCVYYAITPIFMNRLRWFVFCLKGGPSIVVLFEFVEKNLHLTVANYGMTPVYRVSPTLCYPIVIKLGTEVYPMKIKCNRDRELISFLNYYKSLVIIM